MSAPRSYDLVNEPWSCHPTRMFFNGIDDWTEDVVPGIKRPLLIGETGTYEILLNGLGKKEPSLNVPTPLWLPTFMRTDRPIHPSKDGSIDVRVCIGSLSA